MKYETLKEDLVTGIKESAFSLPKNIWETYSAFCNTCGGTIYLGISEKKQENLILGVEDPEKLKIDFFTTINNKSKVSMNILNDDNFNIVDYKELR